MGKGKSSTAEAQGTGCLRGGGELGALLRGHNWSKTSVGPPESWPAPLRAATRNLLSDFERVSAADGPGSPAGSVPGPKEAGLVDREARLSFALTAARIGYWEVDLQTGRIVANDLDKAMWGRKPDEELTYEAIRDSIHPDDRDRHLQAMARAVEERVPFDVEYRNVWPDGSVHWLAVRGQTVYDSAGAPQAMVGVTLDITDRKRTEESLRAHTHTLEVLNRVGSALAGNLDVHRIVQAVTDAATEVSGAQFGAFFYNVINEKGESYMLYALSGVPREAFAKFPMPRNTAIFDPTFRGLGIVRSDDIRRDPRYGRNAPHYGMPAGHLPVVSYLAVPVVSRSGEVLGGLFFGHERPGVFDTRVERIVTGIAAQAAIAVDNARLFESAQAELVERHRVERHQELLLAELNHRVKNTLAIVLSIATQTLRHAPTADAFRSGFEARIMALAEAHNLLTDGNWAGASLHAIVDRVLRPFQSAAEPRYVISAERDVHVGPRAAVALVMALHELATNAAKYGALSTAAGRINVGWDIATAASPRLRIVWRERGGPRVKQSHRRGFGMRLIRGLAEDAAGTVEMDFAPSGLVATFDLPPIEDAAHAQ